MHTSSLFRSVYTDECFKIVLQQCVLWLWFRLECYLYIFAFLSEDTSGEVTLMKGEMVMVVRASPRRGHLVVEHKNHTIHVPYQFLELKPSEGVNIWTVGPVLKRLSLTYAAIFFFKWKLNCSWSVLS